MATRNPDDEEEIEDDDDAEAPPRRNPLRLIILGLLGLVVLCVICFLAFRLLGNNLLGALPFPIPGIPVGQATVTPVPGETVAPLPTTGQPPATEPPGGVTGTPAPTEPPGATEELPPTTQPTGEVPPTTQPTGEVPPTTQPTGEILPTTQPTGEVSVEPTDMVDEHGGELPTATTIPVPGPTPTPTLGPPPADCSANTPPSAEAGDPYSAMMGKGQGFVTVDGSGSSDPDGTIVKYEWDFGDGSAPEEGQTATHGYTSAGGYVVTLTITDDCGATAQDTADVVVTGPTPPAPSTTPSATVEPTPPATTQPSEPVAGTIGFCYRVQPGNTLTGVANYFGVSVPILAEVNGVSPVYYVIAGQGLFIPTGEILDGPNLYEVQSGDTLDSIAFQCGLSTARLAGANGLTPGQSLTPGQLLGIPLWSWY